MASYIEIRIFFLLIGVILGFILTWSFVGHKYWNCKFYKEEYEKYYEKWFNIHKYANNAYWYLHDRWKQPGNDMDELCKQAYYQLCHWYEDEEGENK